MCINLGAPEFAEILEESNVLLHWQLWPIHAHKRDVKFRARSLDNGKRSLDFSHLLAKVVGKIAIDRGQTQFVNKRQAKHSERGEGPVTIVSAEIQEGNSVEMICHHEFIKSATRSS